MARVAVVTGSNKGIGLAIVKGLSKTFEGDVFLTSRSVERGLKAVDKLKQVVKKRSFIFLIKHFSLFLCFRKEFK